MFFSGAFFFSNDQTIQKWSHWRTLIFPLDVLLLVVTHTILYLKMSVCRRRNHLRERGFHSKIYI